MEIENKFKFFVSESAKEQIKKELEKRKTPNSFLRIGIKGGSCEGFSYLLRFEDISEIRDIIFDNVIIDSKSIIYLNGSTLDYEKALIKSKFIIKNPQEKSKCSCGNSFSI